MWTVTKIGFVNRDIHKNLVHDHNYNHNSSNHNS